MKTDLNNTINKLISYAFDNLLLDPLDEVYTLNRLATLCGVATPVRDEDADYGDATLGELLDELGANINRATVADVLMPMPRTVSMRFNDLLDRNTEKAFEFLYELYAHGDKLITASPAYAKDGYTCYAYGNAAPALVTLPAVGAEYSPVAVGGKAARFVCADDLLTEDALAREVAYVTNYGGVVATRIDGVYYTAESTALDEAQTQKQLADTAVKTYLLDYPVPALAFNGIAKNAVMREVTRVLKRASDAGLKPVVAATAKNGVTLYLVFAGDVNNEYLAASDPLTACGVFAVNDYSALLPVLEKGTALSTDLMAFKPIYDVIGGAKHGAKATAALGSFLASKITPALTAAALATADEAVALTTVE